MAKPLSNFGSRALRDILSRHPSLFRVALLLTRRKLKVLVRPTTDILIEGFPRSANTFAVVAFRAANPGLRIANHIHNPAHVLLALRLAVPAVVLLRNPADAIRSLLVRRPELSVGFVVRDYVRFHEILEDQLERIVVVKFETVVGDYAAAIRHINNKFSLNFQLYSEALHRQAVLAEIDHANAGGHQGRVEPRHVPRPHADRDALKQKISLVGHERMLARAEQVYQRFLQVAV